jgi:hypothetical protein
MSNFADFLKSLNIEISVSSQSYVYYDSKTGTIDKITNNKVHDDVYSVLEVPHESVAEIITGLRSTNDFIVEYDASLKQLALKEITYLDNLPKIESKMHRLPVVRSSTDEFGEKSSLIFDSIYDGVEVFLWVKNQFYAKGTIVWFKNKVYKTLEDLPQSNDFDFSKVEMFIDNVWITNIKSMNHFVELKSKFQPIYEDIKVDVWYQELEHLPGQHVWAHDTVYRIKNYQPADTSFDLENVDVIEKEVFLYNDSNKYLNFYTELKFGDKILDNNQLFLFTEEKIDDIRQSKKSIMFYASRYEGLLYDDGNKQLARFSFIEKNDQVVAEYHLSDTIELFDTDYLSNGQKVLIGKSLYLTNTLSERDVDVNVVQNNLLGCWEIYLGRNTRKSLETVNYIGQDKMYFSVTAKHDPNILYRTMEFSLVNLLRNKSEKYPFQYEWEFDRTDVSVYTSKFFETYSHEILE